MCEWRPQTWVIRYTDGVSEVSIGNLGMGATVSSRSLTPELHVAICTLKRNVYAQRWQFDEMARSFERLSKQLANG